MNLPAKHFPGQRHDVIIHANQTSGNYWLRLATGNCARAPTHRPAQMGAILHYEDADNSEPTTTGVAMRTGCDDETNLTPFVYNEVPADIMPQEPMDVGSVQNNSTENLFRWTIDGSTFRIDWNQPSLKTVLEGGTDYGNTSNVYEIETKHDVSILHLLPSSLTQKVANLFRSGTFGGSQILAASPILSIFTATISTLWARALAHGTAILQS